MKKLLFLIGLLFFSSTVFAQEMPNDIKRYDYKKVGDFQRDTYTVMVITDCITNEKEYKLRISYRVEFDNGNHETKMLYIGDSVVTEMIKVFSYLTTAKFGPELDGEESFIIFEIGDALFFKFRTRSQFLELLIDDNRVMPSIYDVYDDDVDDIYNAYKAKSRQHVLARFSTESDIKEFGALLQKIEKTFTEKGRNLKNTVISDDNKIEPQKIQL